IPGGKLAASEVAQLDPQDLVATVKGLYESRDYGKALREVMAFADAVNLHFARAEPGKLWKEGKGEQAARVCSECVEAFKVLTACLKPVLPELAAQAEAF